MESKISSIWSYVKKITGGLDTRNIGEVIAFKCTVVPRAKLEEGDEISIRSNSKGSFTPRKSI
ncbi:hypothetical protein [Leptospira alexanderi]|uniref:hypothetical protein n=1 Tax=Leptospira alexanderi TaxID=100053 RepID=UPI0015908950|nr:hypothetical protein [Leptospira alexanderi]